MGAEGGGRRGGGTSPHELRIEGAQNDHITAVQSVLADKDRVAHESAKRVRPQQLGIDQRVHKHGVTIRDATKSDDFHH